MSIVFVARSESLQDWASDVGLTRHVYALGTSDGSPQQAVEGFNSESHAGRTDWELVHSREVDAVDEAALLARVGRKETLVDPTYYPQIKRAKGIIKVKPVNVDNWLTVQAALAGEERKAAKSAKIKPGEIATYLLRMATAG